MSDTIIAPPGWTAESLARGAGTLYSLLDADADAEVAVVSVIPETTVDRTQRGTSVQVAVAGMPEVTVTVCGTGQDRFVELLLALVAKAVSA